jgi:hypothetical protein
MRKLSLGFAALLAGGCVVSSGPNHPDGAGGSQPSLTGLTVYRIKPGASSVLQPGTQAGYAVTANLGGSYRVVWTGDAGVSHTYTEFWGTMWSPGHLTNLVAGCSDGSCALESDDFLSGVRVDSSGGTRVDFDTFATTGLDGFDVVTDTEPVILDLYVDGARLPDLILFFNTDNNQISKAGTLPFGLTTN